MAYLYPLWISLALLILPGAESDTIKHNILFDTLGNNVSICTDALYALLTLWTGVSVYVSDLKTRRKKKTLNV